MDFTSFWSGWLPSFILIVMGLITSIGVAAGVGILMCIMRNDGP